MFGIEDFSQAIVNFNNFEASQLGKAALFGGAIMLIGMVVIFAVLCVIWLCLTLFKVFFHDLPAKKKAEAQDAVITPVAEESEDETSDEEIIAVIAAAIAMAESSSAGAKFKVVSFKRK